MKNNIIDPYELCLCGSGKKYKFCCYKREDKNFHNSNEFKYYIQKNIKRISICIKQDCFCKGEIIKGIILFIIAMIIFIVLKTYLTQNIGLIYIYNLFTAYEAYRGKLNG